MTFIILSRTREDAAATFGDKVEAGSEQEAIDLFATQNWTKYMTPMAIAKVYTTGQISAFIDVAPSSSYTVNPDGKYWRA